MFSNKSKVIEIPACDFNEIKETVNLAESYINNLNSLKEEICGVEGQVETTFKDTRENIKTTFAKVRTRICNILDKREEDLLKKAELIKDEGLQPLKQCRSLIDNKIESSKKLIDEAKGISLDEPQKAVQFLEKATVLGTLPEVPESSEVPFISFSYELEVESEIANLCLGFGEVFRIAPIQIKSITPKPGAMLIEWQQTLEDSDRIKDIQEYKLQRAFGDVLRDKNLATNFIDCYSGIESQFLLRDIQICQPYSFRVCCQFDGSSNWSPWSVPQVGSTTIRWFSWKAAQGICLSNEARIVSLEENAAKTVVLSNGAQVGLTDSVEFTILEVDFKSEIILALAPDKISNSNEINDNDAFTIDSSGKISISGVEKSTILPSFTKGLKVCFSLEPMGQCKIRVNVDCNDKRVTYDWFIGNSSGLYFACQLPTSKWKLMVE